MIGDHTGVGNVVGDARKRRSVVHACPPDGSGIMPCCGRTPFEVPRTDRMTDVDEVTCKGVTDDGR